MGVSTGTFVGANGHTYEVKLSGESVSTRDIYLGVPPVVISMSEGKHKFCGFKTTTATINIVTDGVASGYYTDKVDGIIVSVTDITDNVVEFDGYVTPFAFDQSNTGDYSTVTVNAVDRLTVRKAMKYPSASRVGVTTAFEVVTNICERAGITTIVEQASFEFPEVGGGGLSPLKIAISECGFVQDEMSDCDVLSAIAQFFGYTAIVLGTTLIMYDETCGDGYSYVSRYTDSMIGWGWQTSYTRNKYFQRVNTGDFEVLSDSQYTIERAYDGIKISAAGSKEAIILPDICADENLVATGTSHEVKSGLVPLYHIERRTLLRSKLMNCGFASSMGNFPPIESGTWENGAVFMRISAHDVVKKTLASDGSIIVVNGAASTKNVLWFRGSVLSSDALVASQKTAYSHPGGYIKVNLKFSVVTNQSWNNLGSSVDLGDPTYEVRFLNIRCGEKYFYKDYFTDYEAGEWDGSEGGSYFLMEGYNLLPTGEAQKRFLNEVILKVPDSGGTIGANIAWKGNPLWLAADNYIIEHLSITGWGDEINPEHPDMYHSFSGRTDEMLEVSTVLTTRSSGYSAGTGRVGVNARPSVVASYKWASRWHLTSSDAMPITGCLMEQLKRTYGQKRLVRTMTIRDRVPPYAIVGGQFVQAYDWDIYNNKTTVKI